MYRYVGFPKRTQGDKGKTTGHKTLNLKGFMPYIFIYFKRN